MRVADAVACQQPAEENLCCLVFLEVFEQEDVHLPGPRWHPRVVRLLSQGASVAEGELRVIEPVSGDDRSVGQPAPTPNRINIELPVNELEHGALFARVRNL